MTDNDRLLDSIQTIAERENELLEARLTEKMGVLEMRVNARFAVLENRAELPRRFVKLAFMASGFIGGTAATAIIERLIGGA